MNAKMWMKLDLVGVLLAAMAGVSHAGTYYVATEGSTGNVIENNLVEYNGQHPHLHHGIYADGEDLLVRNNIIRNNAAFGLHLYPSMKKAVVVNNLIYGHHHQSGIIPYSPAGGSGGENLIVNNTVVDNAGGISIAHGNGEKFYNNIVIAEKPGYVFDASEDTVNTLTDYNLCMPSSPLQGPHGLSVDPGFVEPDLMCYWLRADSPARGKGMTDYAPRTDFWGRELPAGTAPDLGALAYSRYWAGQEAMKTSPNRFPNCFV